MLGWRGAGESREARAPLHPTRAARLRGRGPPDPQAGSSCVDNDGVFTQGFDTVFNTEGIPVIRKPVRAPKPNATLRAIRRHHQTSALTG